MISVCEQWFAKARHAPEAEPPTSRRVKLLKAATSACLLTMTAMGLLTCDSVSSGGVGSGVGGEWGAEWGVGRGAAYRHVLGVRGHQNLGQVALLHRIKVDDGLVRLHQRELVAFRDLVTHRLGPAQRERWDAEVLAAYHDCKLPLSMVGDSAGITMTV